MKERERHGLAFGRPFLTGLFLVIFLAVFVILGFWKHPQKQLSEETAEQRVREAGEYSAEDTAVCFLRDYEGDKKPEAFVAIGTSQEEILEGDFWFVSETGEVSLQMEHIWMQKEAQYWEPEGNCFLLFSYIDGNPLLTGVYTVREGQPVDMEMESREWKYVENGELQCTASDYDACYDIEMESFSGHTQKIYPFYWKDGSILPYEAEEISREQVAAYENGEELLAAIEAAHPDGYYEYLLRENGLLHINRAEKREDFLSFFHTTCQISENRFSLLEEGEGCYEKRFHDGEGETFVQRMVREHAAER